MENPKESRSSGVLALRDRVIKGNEKLLQAWLQIRDLPEREEADRYLAGWDAAVEKLRALCTGLEAKGYQDCLYIENGRKTRSCDTSDGLCFICPSLHPYWEWEAGEAGKSLLSAALVAHHTRELLSTRGWCLWKCKSLGGDIVVVVGAEGAEGMPDGYPVYAEAELAELFRRNISQATLRLVHEAKKQVGAVVVNQG
jgi:hypothetical protein